jgi:hypothetical protein
MNLPPMHFQTKQNHDLTAFQLLSIMYFILFSCIFVVGLQSTLFTYPDIPHLTHVYDYFFLVIHSLCLYV